MWSLQVGVRAILSNIKCKCMQIAKTFHIIRDNLIFCTDNFSVGVLIARAPTLSSWLNFVLRLFVFSSLGIYIFVRTILPSRLLFVSVNNFVALFSSFRSGFSRHFHTNPFHRLRSDKTFLFRSDFSFHFVKQI